MTPLALQIVRQLTLPLHHRTIEDRCGLLGMMDGIHCFEITEVLPLAAQICTGIVRNGGAHETGGFLPAPKTWIEWRNPGGERVGTLLDGTQSPSEPIARSALERADGRLIALRTAERLSLRQDDSATWEITHTQTLHYLKACGWASTAICLGALPIINTPKIVGRRQHMPHRGLERELLRLKPIVGRFPLHAWTEIQLRVAPTSDASCDAPAEAHLTGQRALHFCRAHLRVRGGRLEMVRAHWRGDAALGIKRSRYRLRA